LEGFRGAKGSTYKSSEFRIQDAWLRETNHAARHYHACGTDLSETLYKKTLWNAGKLHKLKAPLSLLRAE